MLSTPFLMATAALLGLVIGSFLNVVILRLPTKDSSIIFPASHCPECKTPLAWYENIPVFSFLFLRGKCAHCRTTISPQYPLVEILTSFLAVAVLKTFGPSLEAVGYFIFAAALLVIIFIDIRHQIIPDVISLPGIILGFLFSLFSHHLRWQDSLTGIILGGGVLYAIALFYLLLRKQEGMGGGDIKLLAMIGAWLGWQSLPFVIFFSSFSGSIVGLMAMRTQKKGGSTRIAFGPFLAGTAIIYLFFSKQILVFYRLYFLGQ